MKFPRISIVIATHNRAGFLTEAINSLLTQSYQNFEIIIVDDASQDGTPEVINNLCKMDHRIRTIRSEENIGPGAARNLGIEQANGEYIAVMDDDDIAHPERLEIQSRVLENKPGIGLVSSTVQFFDSHDNIWTPTKQFTSKKFPKSADEVFILTYLHGSLIENTTIMSRKCIWERFKYPTQPWNAEDRFLLLMMAACGVKMKIIDQPLVKVFRDSSHDSLSVNELSKLFSARRQVLKNTREWLTKNNIHRFDDYHKWAVSNQYLRECQHFSGVKALNLLLQAFFAKPDNPQIPDYLKYHAQKVIRHFGLLKSE